MDLSSFSAPSFSLLVTTQGIFHFQLGRGEPMLHTRLRPFCKEFLEKISKMYELHVFTFGSRLYAHTIAGQHAVIADEEWDVIAVVIAYEQCDVIADVMADVMADVIAEVMANVMADVMAGVMADVTADVMPEVMADNHYYYVHYVLVH